MLATGLDDPSRLGSPQRSGAALVVLGCRVGSGSLSPAAERRVDAAALAWHRGTGGLVVASGGRRWGEAVEAIEMGRNLETRGVPRAHLALELVSLTTLDNARFTTDLLRRAGIDEVIVVTCDWHVGRALRDFAAFGLRASAIAAPSPPLVGWARVRRDAREACSEALDARARTRVARLAGEAA